MDSITTARHAWSDRTWFAVAAPWLTSYFTGNLLSVYAHHACRMAAAFAASPLERSTVVSVDGKGDGLSAMAGHATRTAPPSVDVVVPSAHSLGRLWWAASEYAGLPGHHAAGKTMALAGYGNPTYLPHFLRHWRVNSDSGFRMEPGNEHPDLFRQVPRLVDWMARREHVSAWFECDDDSPYMLRIVRARPERWGRDRIGHPRRWNLEAPHGDSCPHSEARPPARSIG